MLANTTAVGSIAQYRHRSGSLILIAVHHELRLSELLALRCDQVDLKEDDVCESCGWAFHIAGR